MNEEEGIRAGPVGRGLRLLTGVMILGAGVVPPLLSSAPQLTVNSFGVFAGLLVFYLVLHVVIQRFVPRLNRWLGAVVAVAPVVAVFLLGGPASRLGSVLFVGVSLLLTAWRSDGGCEVMTLPGMLMGKRTHLVCIAFSPVDWLESATHDTNPTSESRSMPEPRAGGPGTSGSTPHRDRT